MRVTFGSRLGSAVRYRLKQNLAKRKRHSFSEAKQRGLFCFFRFIAKQQILKAKRKGNEEEEAKQGQVNQNRVLDCVHVRFRARPCRCSCPCPCSISYFFCSSFLCSRFYSCNLFLLNVRAASSYSMLKQHRHAAWTCVMHKHGAWAFSKET
jgi:hypothetical protein